MHVDWHWIEQRPHFLVEALPDHCALNVRYFPAKNYVNKYVQDNYTHKALKLKNTSTGQT